MSTLKVLFVGGSGVISSACTRVAAESGIDLYVLNRGQAAARPVPPGVTELRADIRSPRAVRDAIKDLEFDSVVDWVAYTPEHVGTDIGEAFHITSDDVLAWDQIAHALAAALGVTARTVHVPSDAIAAADPEWGAALLGDQAHSMVFDNSKLRSVVPGWRAVIPFE